jgi:replicative DNA helicase
MTLNSLEEYGHSFQIKTIYLLLTKKEFLNNILDGLNELEFPNQAHKWIVANIIDYYNKFHSLPGSDFLKSETQKLEVEVFQLAIKEQLNEIFSCAKNDLAYIEEEFPKFVKNQKLKKALLNSVDLLKSGDFDSIREEIEGALKIDQDKNIGHVYSQDTVSRYKTDQRNPIPFPWEKFNDSTQGGYGEGDLVLIFGNPGGGKSWAIVAMAAHAAMLGKNVVYYALELGETYVGKRFDANITGIPIDQLTGRTDELEQIINKKVKGNIIIKEYSPRRASLRTIENHLKKLEYLHDFKPDVIFIDYLDLLKNKKSRREAKEDIDDIFIEAKGLAKSLKIPIVSPSQINRSGAKDDILEADKIAGSYDKIMIGDISLSLGRKRKDKLQGTGRWHFMKNRFGPDGMTYNSTIDTSTGHIEINEDISDIENEGADFNNLDRDDKKMLKTEFKHFFQPQA